MKNMLKKYGLVILTVFFLLAFQIIGLPNSNDSVEADKKAGLFGFNLFNELNFFNSNESEVETEEPDTQEEVQTPEDEQSQDEEQTPEDDFIPEAPICVCDVLCTVEFPNLECELCSLVEDGDYSNCCQTEVEEETAPEVPEEEEEEEVPELEEETAPEEEEVPELEEETAPEEEELPELEEEVAPEEEEVPEVEEEVVPEDEVVPELEEETTPELPELEEEVTPELPELEEETAPEEVLPEVAPDSVVPEVTPEEVPILSSGVTYNNKDYDETTIFLKDEETISIDITIPARNEGGTLLVEVPEGLELVNVTLSTSQEDTIPQEETVPQEDASSTISLLQELEELQNSLNPSSDTSSNSALYDLLSGKTDTKSSTMAVLDVGAKNGVNSFTVEAGVNNSFAISVKIDPYIVDSDSMDVWGDREINFTYTNLHGEKVGNTSVKVNTVEYLQFVIDSQNPSTITSPVMSISTSYASKWYDDPSSEIELTNNDYIRIKTTLTGNSSGGTISYTLPTGMELVNAPGVNSLNSSGVVVPKDFLLSETYFVKDDEYDWELDETYTNWSDYLRKNGTLSYNVTSADIADISVYVRVDTNFIIYSDSNKNEFDAIKVTFTPTNATDKAETLKTPSFTLATNTYELSTPALSAVENMDSFLGSVVGATSTLLEGYSDTVNVSGSVAITDNFINSKTIYIKNLVLTVCVPEGAVITSPYYTTPDLPIDTDTFYSADGDDISYDKYEITIINNSSYKSVSSSSGRYTYTLSDFMTVQFPIDKFGLNGASKAEHAIYIDSYGVDILEFEWGVVNNTQNKPCDGVFVWESLAFDTARRTYVTIEEYIYGTHSYSIGWTGAQGDTEIYNLNNNSPQTLYSVTRYFKTSETRDNLTNLPIRIDYNQDKVSIDGAEATYLDNVTKVVMAVPLLADIDRYSASLSKIEVTFEDGVTETFTNFDTANNSNASSTTGAWKQNATTKGWYPQLGTSSSNGTFKSDNFTAVYTANTFQNSNPTYSNITVTSSTKNIVGISLYLVGDNETHTDGKYYVYGRPKSETPTVNADGNAEYSDHGFVIRSYEVGDYDFTADEYSGTSTSPIRGFRWKEPEEFYLNIDRIDMTTVTPKTTYTFNTARYNMQMQIANWINNPRGYIDYGITSYRNLSGSDTDFFQIKVETNYYDVIKEIMFPYNNSSDKTQITSIEYGYKGDTSNYFYSLDYHGVANVPFTVEKRSVHGETSSYYAYNSMYMKAPDGKQFDYVTVTYNNWGLTSEYRYVMLKGYSDDISYNAAKNNTHKLYFSHDPEYLVGTNSPIFTDKYSGTDGFAAGVNSVGKILADISSEGVGIQVLNTTSGTIPGEDPTTPDGTKVDGLVDYNVLVSGTTNTLEYYVFAGSSVYSDQGFRGVAFDVILPDNMELTAVYASENLFTMNSTSYYSSYFAKELVGDITFEKIATPVSNHFGTTEETVDGTRYRVTLTDDQVRLYGFYSFKSPYGLNQLGFKLSLDINVIDASYSLIPLEKVLFMGSTVHNVSWTSASATNHARNAGTSAVDGHGFSKSAVKVQSGKYLYIDTFPFVSVHSANVEIYDDDGNGTQYFYKTNDNASIAVLENNKEEATINFKVTNTIEEAGRVAYVYFPLPLSDGNLSDLITTQEFVVTLDDNPISMKIDGTSLDFTDQKATSNGATIEWRLRDLPAQTNVINIDEVERDWAEAEKAEYNPNPNTLILKLSNFPAGTLDVSVGIIGPEIDKTAINAVSSYATISDDDGPTLEDDYEFPEATAVEFSAVSIFTSGGATGIYFGGYGPDPSFMTVNSAYIGKNPVHFEFDYKTWEVDFKPILTYTLNGANVVTDIPSSSADYTGYAKTVGNKDTYKEWGTFPGEVVYPGYNFEGIFTDSGMTVKADGTESITQDTTYYVKYTPKDYHVNYYIDNILQTETRTVSWDRTDLSALTTNTIKFGYEFVGWSYDKTNVISTSDKYGEVATKIYGSVNNATNKSSIDLYAVYEPTEYTIFYDLVGAENATGLTWEDTNLIQHSVSTYVIGKTFLGWGLSVDDKESDLIVEGVTTFGEVYKRYIDEFNGVDNQSVTLVPVYTSSEYYIRFDANGYSFSDTTNLDTDISVGWTSWALEKAPNEPTIEGKKFVGWSVQESNPTSFVTEYMYYSNVALSLGYGDTNIGIVVTLYAHFEDIEYTVIYDFNQITYNGAPDPMPNPNKVTWDETIYNASLFNTSTMYGTDDIGTFLLEQYFLDRDADAYFGNYVEFTSSYKFVGWYKDAEYNDEITDISAVVLKELATSDQQESVTVYAKYQIVHYAIIYGISDKDGAGKSLNDVDIQYLADNVSFYERGRQDPDTDVVPNSTNASSFIEKGKYYSYPDIGFVVDGYMWEGWEAVDTLGFVDKAGGIANYYVDNDTVSKDTKYYKLYGYEEDNSNGKYFQYAVDSDSLEEALTINGVFTPKYYKVEYYATTSDSTSETDMKLIKTTGATEISWQGGGLYLEYDDLVSDTTVETKTGWKFKGWYTNSTGEGEPITDLSVLADYTSLFNSADVDDTTFSEGTKLKIYAVYDQTFYTMDYNLGYTPTTDDANYSYTSTVSLALDGTLSLPTNLTREGYTFGGWYVDRECTTHITTSNKVWTFEDYYRTINSSDTVDYDSVTISEGDSITVYAKWSLQITLGITNSDVLFVIDSGDSSGQLSQSYSITNHSYDNIIGIQYVSMPDTGWEFSPDPVYDPNASTDTDTDGDDGTDDETDSDTETDTGDDTGTDGETDGDDGIEDISVLGLNMIEEFAYVNEITEDEALFILEDMGVLDEVLAVMELAEEVDEVAEPSEMYVMITLILSDTAQMELPLYAERVGTAPVMKDATLTADVLFEYKINQDYEDGTIIDLFHIDYRFGLDS